MSTLTADIFETVMKATTMPPPSNPMALARKLVEALYRTSDGVAVLHDHRGDFYRWNGLY
jgi:hypothetical protein